MGREFLVSLNGAVKGNKAKTVKDFLPARRCAKMSTEGRDEAA
jgi:hypothetical protein